MLTSNSQLEESYKVSEYYVASVVDYTSRYNNSKSLGYAPENLSGPELHYPGYGDFPDTYVLRFYGLWRRKSDSVQSEYRPQDCDPLGAEDYIVVRFEKGVIPKHVFIYETYNPGAVVRIWGRYSNDGIWKILWEGPPQLCPQTSRKFIPPIRQIYNIIDEIRLDLNQSLLKYPTAFDAILLVGYTPKTKLQIKLLTSGNLSFHTQRQEKLAIKTSSSHETDLFSSLPHEIMVRIFQYLDLKSLCRSAQVNKQWYNTSLDSSLYNSLSLKKYWHKIEDHLLLNYFTVRCKGLRKLDLSWCGKDNKITEDVFVCFLRSCGKHLTHLSLDNCDFIKTKALAEIATCSELVDLRLRNCQPSNVWDFSLLSSLNKLTALDLYSASIIDEALIVILRSNLELKHLILDFCDNLDKLDLVAETVSQYNKNLMTWSSWKAASLTAFGIKHLANNCHNLKELDFGWCLFQSDPADCLEKIAFGCKNLRRLNICKWLGVTDNLVRPIIQHCTNIEQLDLLGITNITGDICEQALIYLKKLELLELSYCDGIRDEQFGEKNFRKSPFREAASLLGVQLNKTADS